MTQKGLELVTKGEQTLRLDHLSYPYGLIYWKNWRNLLNQHLLLLNFLFDKVKIKHYIEKGTLRYRKKKRDVKIVTQNVQKIYVSSDKNQTKEM